MKVAVLTDKTIVNKEVVRDIFRELEYTDQIYLDCKPTSETEKLIASIAPLYGIKTEFVPRATACADAVIVIYNDGEYEWNVYEHSYYDCPFGQVEERELIVR